MPPLSGVLKVASQDLAASTETTLSMDRSWREAGIRSARRLWNERPPQSRVPIRSKKAMPEGSQDTF
jgi:hypothetical protein